MAIEVILEANPPALRSHIPREALQLAATPERRALDGATVKGISYFRRTADYIAAAMIFLRDNVLLQRDLQHDDIKGRLLGLSQVLRGHWGTCPGLSLIYAHLNVLISRHDLDMIYLVGPGHGAPSVLACLWLERSLERFYPQYTRDENGLGNLVKGFSTPSGLPSHINAQTPGCLHDGGELGYVLAVAFGAVMDKPDLIVCAVIGDGEAETGPTATAWHANKYIDPAESGAVIPVLHVNGFKISERGSFGCMDEEELVCLFTGYGYHPCIVDDLADIDTALNNALEWALDEIHMI